MMPGTTKNLIEKLPKDILNYTVCDFLDILTLARIGAVSKNWLVLSQDPQIFRKRTTYKELKIIQDYFHRKTTSATWLNNRAIEINLAELFTTITRISTKLGHPFDLTKLPPYLAKLFNRCEELHKLPTTRHGVTPDDYFSGFRTVTMSFYRSLLAYELIVDGNMESFIKNKYQMPLFSYEGSIPELFNEKTEYETRKFSDWRPIPFDPHCSPRNLYGDIRSKILAVVKPFYEAALIEYAKEWVAKEGLKPKKFSNLLPDWFVSTKLDNDDPRFEPVRDARWVSFVRDNGIEEIEQEITNSTPSRLPRFMEIRLEKIQPDLMKLYHEKRTLAEAPLLRCEIL